MKRLFLLGLLVASQFSFAGDCFNKNTFNSLKAYILEHGYVQSSAAPPFPQVHHYSDKAPDMEFEHFTLYTPNKEFDHEKILIKKANDLKYAYYVVLRKKKLTVEYHTDNSSLQIKYEAHFCDLMHKMGFHDS